MDWIKIIDERLLERNAQVNRLADIVDCFTMLACSTERLYDECEELRGKVKEAELTAEQVRQEVNIFRRSSLTASALSPASSNAILIDVKRLAELEARYGAIKDERAELYKAASQNTLKLLDLTDQVKQRDVSISNLEKKLSAYELEVKKYEQKLFDADNLIKEKNFTIQILQDELTALQLELLNIDDTHVNDNSHEIKLKNVSTGNAILQHGFEVLSNKSSMLPQEYHVMQTHLSNDQPFTVGLVHENVLCVATGHHIHILGDSPWSLKVNSIVSKLSIIPKKALIVVGRRDGIVSLVSQESRRLRGQLVSPDSVELKDMIVTGDGEYVWTLSPSALKYWHCDRTICLRTISIKQGEFDNVYVGNAAGTIQRINITTGEFKQVHQGPTPVIKLVTALPPNHPNILLAVYADRVILFQRDKPIHSFMHGQGVGAVITAGFFQASHVYIVTSHKLLFYGLSGFEVERGLEFPDSILDLIDDVCTVLCEHDIYKLIN